jgi:SAM-dependent MidA family methyltransferase
LPSHRVCRAITVCLMGGISWRDAWQQALYGPRGFYRAAGGPGRHFTTATHGVLGRALARALVQLAGDRGLTHIVDIGAGRGELLSHLAAADQGLRLTGVDVVQPPEGLPPGVVWAVSPGGPALPDSLDRLHDALVVAHEWLDVVPCDIAEVDDDGVLRHRLVDPATGVEAWGDPVVGSALGWAERHWPASLPGHRVEIGESRDEAWAGLLARIASGVAIAVDYGHRGGERPVEGTLTAYRSGNLADPVPDGSCDLTAHVAMDTLDHDDLIDQRTALRGLGLDSTTPPMSLAAREPQAYLRALEESSAAGALMARGGFGDFLWSIKHVG